jgi:CHASE3 domain sensor protein
MTLQWIGNLKIFEKLLIVIVPPLVAFCLYGSIYTYDKYDTEIQFEHSLQLSQLAVINSKLVHEIQKERGMSAGFIGSGGKVFANNLPSQRTLTDQQVQLFINAANDPDLSQSIRSMLALVSQDLQQLTQTRRDICIFSCIAIT